MEKTIAVLNEMIRQGVISRYAIGGGIGALFYIEPFETHDLDVFIDAPEKGRLVTLEPVHEYLRRKGYHMEEDLFSVEGVVVQFLPITPGLVDEAAAGAITHSVGAEQARVMSPEHLLAIMVQLGRPAKDLPRIASFLDQAPIDRGRLGEILKRHGLTERWQRIERSLHGGTE